MADHIVFNGKETFCGCSWDTKKTDCYFYSEEKDMGANISSCDYYMRLGYCPCDFCDKYIKKTDVYSIVRKMLDGGVNDGT